MKRLIFILFAFLTAVSLFAAESSDVRDILNELDSYIEDSNRYVAAKNEKIAAIQEELSKKGGQDYDLNYALFDEYKSFRFDSAYFYAGKAFELARESQNKEQIVQSHYAKAFCYLSSGLFLEAFYEMSLINPLDVPYALKDEYYVLYTRLYHAASEYNEAVEWSGIYAGKSAQYADSVLAVVSKDSYKHLFMDAQKAANSGRKELGIKIYKEILSSFDVEVILALS